MMKLIACWMNITDVLIVSPSISLIVLLLMANQCWAPTTKDTLACLSLKQPHCFLPWLGRHLLFFFFPAIVKIMFKFNASVHQFFSDTPVDSPPFFHWCDDVHHFINRKYILSFGCDSRCVGDSYTRKNTLRVAYCLLSYVLLHWRWHTNLSITLAAQLFYILINTHIWNSKQFKIKDEYDCVRIRHRKQSSFR